MPVPGDFPETKTGNPARAAFPVGSAGAGVMSAGCRARLPGTAWSPCVGPFDGA